MKQFTRPAQASRKYFYFLIGEIGEIGMRFSLKMGILLVLLSGLCVPAYSTILNGCLVTPGSTVIMAGCDATTAPFGTLLATLSAPYTSTLGTSSGTLVSAVYREAGGTLDFYYQVFENTTAGNASGAGGCGHGGGQPACDPTSRLTDTDFSTWITNLAFRTDGGLAGFFVNGTVPPITGDRNSPVGNVIGFSFFPPDSSKILPGTTSNILIISTNATNFKAGNATMIDGGVTTVASFAPAALVSSPPTVSKAFMPTSIAVGGTSTITITLTNPNAVPLFGAAFTDTYPANLVNTGTPMGATTCGAGVVTAANNGTSVALTNGTIPASSSCTVTVNVTSSMVGMYNNQIGVGAVTTANSPANTGTASATLTVVTTGAIPTLSGWTLLLLSLMLSCIAFVALKRN